jgi:protein-L-isoaspartate(D-aspartate) O-methyltransferase
MGGDGTIAQMWQRVREWMRMTNQTNKPFPWADQWPEIVDPRVRAAFAVVPRRAFLDLHLARFADQDTPLPIGEGQTISQPFVVALMVQALDPAGRQGAGDRAGSGYQTAILCELAAPGRAGGQWSMPSSACRRWRSARRRRCTQLGYFPHLRVGDGAAGWPEAAPFAAIVVSAAAMPSRAAHRWGRNWPRAGA